jgi:hypothetical protein
MRKAHGTMTRRRSTRSEIKCNSMSVRRDPKSMLEKEQLSSSGPLSCLYPQPVNVSRRQVRHLGRPAFDIIENFQLSRQTFGGISCYRRWIEIDRFCGVCDMNGQFE